MLGRRIVKGDLPFYGAKVFSAAGTINLDGFEKPMAAGAACSFIVFIVLLLASC